MDDDQERDYNSATQRLTELMNRASALLTVTPEVLAANVVPEKQPDANDLVAEIAKLSWLLAGKTVDVNTVRMFATAITPRSLKRRIKSSSLALTPGLR